MTDAIERRVRDAVAANVDLMPGPSRVIERAIASAAARERQQHRDRLVAAGLTGATITAAAVAIALACGWRPPA